MGSYTICSVTGLMLQGIMFLAAFQFMPHCSPVELYSLSGKFCNPFVGCNMIFFLPGLIATSVNEVF
jgi:hypothetical protein